MQRLAEQHAELQCQLIAIMAELAAERHAGGDIAADGRGVVAGASPGSRGTHRLMALTEIGSGSHLVMETTTPSRAGDVRPVPQAGPGGNTRPAAAPNRSRSRDVSQNQFKWSPRRGTWMRSNLIENHRRDFFQRVLDKAREADARVLVVIEDTDRNPAVAGQSAEFDTVIMFIERAESYLQGLRSTGLVITDRPGGGRAAEDEFLTDCLEVLLTGTPYVSVERIPVNVLSTSSHLVRLLQLADLVTSCTTAYVAGEDTYAPAVFPAILAIAHRDYDCVGGRGIKIHPDGRYRNLYHWLFGDADFVRFQVGVPFPMGAALLRVAERAGGGLVGSRGNKRKGLLPATFLVV